LSAVVSSAGLPGVTVNLLDRYILKSVLGACLAAVGLFAFVLMLGNALRDLLGYLLAGQISLGTFAWLIALLVPFVISYALPMGMLTGVLLTLGRLSADSEITAMRTAGLSLGRIARPVILLGVLGAGLGLYINLEAMPKARTQYQRELAAAVQANPLNFIVPRTFIRQFPGFVVYVGEKEGTALRDFWLWELDDQRRVQRLVRAAEGRLEYDETDHLLRLTLIEAQIELRQEDQPENFSEPPLVGTFARSESVPLRLDNIFGRSGGVRQKLKWMTYGELTSEAKRVATQPAPADDADRPARELMKVRLTLQDKFTTAAAVFTFALIGVPLGVRVSRRETSANLGIAVALALGYYFLTVVVNWLDRLPALRPDLLLWLPHVVLVLLAGWLFSRLERR
jgi:lipopolysaccharide export system permease protein